MNSRQRLKRLKPDRIAEVAGAVDAALPDYFANCSDLQRKTVRRLLSLSATCVNYAVLWHRIFAFLQIRCHNPVVYSVVFICFIRKGLRQGT
jgi:hypothetical protein